MPYGVKPAAEIRLAALQSAERLFSMNCKALVVACNTATVTAIDDIRALFSARPVIGLEPAVKPCYRELGKSGKAVALVTAATYNSAKFARLVDNCDGKIIPLAVPELAKLIEDHTDDIRAVCARRTRAVQKRRGGYPRLFALYIHLGFDTRGLRRRRQNLRRRDGRGGALALLPRYFGFDRAYRRGRRHTVLFHLCPRCVTMTCDI